MLGFIDTPYCKTSFGPAWQAYVAAVLKVKPELVTDRSFMLAESNTDLGEAASTKRIPPPWSARPPPKNVGGDDTNESRKAVHDYLCDLYSECADPLSYHCLRGAEFSADRT